MRNTLKRKAAMGLAAVAMAAGGVVFSGGSASAEPLCNYISDSSRPTIYPTNVSSAVKQIQCLINNYSNYPYWLDVDGEYGPATKDAVGYVQSCNRTSGGVDYIVGSSTWNALYNPIAACRL
ncbi:peptidoglycan-binding domain-containing protein [Actinacidiphila sp. bgisy167]|uniref:peptidoglycan-binding domain-containing protein n=1 Tax=Actinacidiphila sp. bgisy167 TaxID=3413797 RepID=UPI003D7582E6